MCFNPRTHTGCDVDIACLLHVAISFNPRTHTGCDPLRLIPRLLFVCFNPRTHTGCDLKAQGVSDIVANVSIHAPTRGATAAGFSRSQTATVSIHAPTRGAT